MTTEIEKALWQDYKDVSDLINGLDVKDNGEAYINAQETKDKIRQEIIKVEQIKLESENQKLQISSDSRKDTFRNVISIATFGITTALSAWTICKTFKFDETGTVTSTLGKGMLNGVIPKLLKR